MSTPRILIVGLSTRGLAESASRAGYECVSVDAFGDLDQKQRAENLSLLRDLGRPYSAAAAVAAARRYAVESVAYVGNLENHPAAVGRLAKGRTLLGNSPATLTRARDFARLKAVVERAGGQVPLSFEATQVHELPKGRRFLRKPRRGGGGNGVGDFNPGARLSATEMLQERIEGVLGSVTFAADGSRAALLGISRGLAGDTALGARAYRYCGSLYPLAVEARLVSHLDALAQETTRAFGLVGVSGLDFVLRDGEAFVLELNPRYCASMELVERAGGASVFETHVAACRGSLPVPLATRPDGVFGKGVLWARSDLVAPDTRAWLSREDVRDVPFPGERTRRGQPICTVFARAADSESCYRQLVVTAGALERELRVREEART